MRAIIEILKKEALSIYSINRLNNRVVIGYVASALCTEKGNIYTGLSIEMPCSIGFCAEHSAIAEMLKKRETKINYIIAVCNGKIILPCGRCRELIRQIDENNFINTKIIYSDNSVYTLNELLPNPYIIK